MVELLAPAGNFETLQAALNAGADAVYFGVGPLNMRQGARNFSMDDLAEIARRSHEHGARAYLAINTIVYETEREQMHSLVAAAKAAGIDAIICWDHAVIMACRAVGIEIHLSTQASVSNFDALKFYYDTGVRRFVLARELTLPMIRDIIQHIHKEGLDAEIECFVHGAMCISESGRCFMSAFCNNKSANRGECLQTCRRSYVIKDEETGNELRLENSYVLSPKDMCTIKILDKLLDAGIHVFKIEGRMRSPEYVDTVVRCYREAIDAHAQGKLTPDIKDRLEATLLKVYHRGFSDGFYMGVPIAQWSAAYGSLATQRRTLLGPVLNYYKQARACEFKVEADARLRIGDALSITGPTTGLVRCTVASMRDDTGAVQEASQGMVVAVACPDLVRAGDKVFLLEDVDIV